MIGSDNVSWAIGTINGNDIKALTIIISISPGGKKITNQALGGTLGGGGGENNGCSLTHNTFDYNSTALNLSLLLNSYLICRFTQVKVQT